VKATTLVIGGALLAAGIGTAAVVIHKTPAEKACEGLHRVCGDRVEVAACTTKLDRASPNEIEDLQTCVDPADTCLEAVACFGGAVLRDAGEGFFRGLTQTD
jgi:hypothetical protein